MGFSDWIYIEPAPMVHDRHAEEIDSRARRKLAAKVQERLKSRLDPGVDLRNARTANAVRSYVDGGRLVIDRSGDPASSVAPVSDEDEEASARAGSIDDLFQLGGGVPDVETDASGKSYAVFRSISLSALEMRRDEQDAMVESVVGDVVQQDLVDAYEDATHEVDSEHPDERARGR